MITNEQIPAVLDHPVLDEGGKKIGEAKHVFLDDATGRPEWASVKTGLFGTSETFVPIRDASLVDDHIEVPYSKSKVKDAPHVDVDAGGHLSESEEHRLYEYYGMRWDESWARANEPGEGGWAARQDTTDTGMGTGTGADAGMGQDDAMTRSEEEMHVGVERREAGRARLRKYIVTEEEQRTVPLRHEEVRVEREPITETNRDAALSGPEISEADHEVVLHEERPVVETEAVPKERVRLTTDEHTERKTVRGQVRKERIEGDAENVDATDAPDDTDEPGYGR
jgi:stress response protein YsnF